MGTRERRGSRGRQYPSQPGPGRPPPTPRRDPVPPPPAPGPAPLTARLPLFPRSSPPALPPPPLSRGSPPHPPFHPRTCYRRGAARPGPVPRCLLSGPRRASAAPSVPPSPPACSGADWRRQRACAPPPPPLRQPRSFRPSPRHPLGRGEPFPASPSPPALGPARRDEPSRWRRRPLTLLAVSGSLLRTVTPGGQRP